MGRVVAIGWATPDQLTADMAELLRRVGDPLESQVVFLPAGALWGVVDVDLVLCVVRNPDLGPSMVHEARSLAHRPRDGVITDELQMPDLGRPLVHWTTPERLSPEYLARYQEIQSGDDPDPGGPGKFVSMEQDGMDIIVVVDEDDGPIFAERWAYGWRPDWSSPYV